MRSSLSALSLFLLSSLLLWSACSRANPPDTYIARVGSAYLTEEDLAEQLREFPLQSDSLSVREHLINQWINNELLMQEAQDQGLPDDPVVQQMVMDNVRSVLISALIAQFYESGDTPTSVEIEAYYDRNREQLALRQPYARIRYLATANADSAEAARSLLQAALLSQDADSLWPILVNRFAQDPAGSLALSGNYFPRRSLLAQIPPLAEALRTLQPRNIAPILEAEAGYHVLQLVDVVPTGTIPELAWVEDQLRERVRIEKRKQILQRQVQRLRNEATARNILEIH